MEEKRRGEERRGEERRGEEILSSSLLFRFFILVIDGKDFILWCAISGMPVGLWGSWLYI